MYSFECHSYSTKVMTDFKGVPAKHLLHGGDTGGP